MVAHTVVVFPEPSEHVIVPAVHVVVPVAVQSWMAKHSTKSDLFSVFAYEKSPTWEYLLNLLLVERLPDLFA